MCIKKIKKLVIRVAWDAWSVVTIFFYKKKIRRTVEKKMVSTIASSGRGKKRERSWEEKKGMISGLATRLTEKKI